MKNKRKLLYLLLVPALAVMGVSIGFGAWQIVYIDNSSGEVEESFYSITYHDYAWAEPITINGLELGSGVDLLELPVTEARRNHNPAYYLFVGWKIGTSSGVTNASSIFSNNPHHIVKNFVDEYSLRSVTLTDKAIHLYSCWSSDIPSNKVLLNITYSDNDDYSSTYKQLVDPVSKFYLWHLHQIDGYHMTNISYNGGNYTPNDYIDLSSLPVNQRSIDLTVTLASNSPI